MKKLLFLFLMCSLGILIWMPLQAQNSTNFRDKNRNVAKNASHDLQKMEAEQKQHLDDLKEKLKSQALNRIQNSRLKNGVSDNTFVSIEDSLALVALYNATDGPNWYNNENWLVGPVESWYGMSGYDGIIYGIDLQYNNLNGIIPPEIGILTNLEFLFLQGNQLIGNIPPEIGNLVNLGYLGLSGNQFTGSLPSEIGNLINLPYLYISNTQISGSIPPEIGNLVNLSDLNLDYNQLTGEIPHEIGNLTNLYQLELNDNQLSGSIPPEIGNLYNLYSLGISMNQLTGSIPPEIGNLYNLNSLSINNNLLNGSIPTEICNLMTLSYFGFHYNYFDLESCPVINCLRDRGVSLSSGAQNIGYNLDLDCNNSVFVEIGLDEDWICVDDSSYYFGNVTAEGYSYIWWFTTIGTGYFSDETSLNPTYHPSIDDMKESIIDIWINVSNDEHSKEDCMLLHLSPIPTINVGEDAAINKGQFYYSSLVNAKDYASTIWTTNGDGIFTNDTTIITSYSPGPQDLDNAQVELCLTASPISPCFNEVQDCLVLTILPEMQTINLNQGWSGISSLILPTDQNVESIFQPVLQELIILQNETSTFWPEQGVNTIGLWDTQKGYTIKVANTVDLTIIGITENEKTLELAYGWNLIPVLNNNSISIADLFNDTDVEIIKEVAGTKVYWPGLNIHSLDSLIPGKAYYVKMNNPANVTYPDILTVSPQSQNVTKLSGELVFEVVSNLSWIVSENASWLTVTPMGGYKNGNFTVKYELNLEEQNRSAEILLSSSDGLIVVLVTITQEAGPVWLCGQRIIDTRDGKSYSTVEIGEQCWMAENLNVGTQIDSWFNQSDNQIIEKYCYDNWVHNCNVYGGLYRWNEMMQYSSKQGIQGICPDGWHLPSNNEWTTLINYLGGEFVAGSKIKEAGGFHWISPNVATNSSGFSALPGGLYDPSGYANSLGYEGYLWSTNLHSSTKAKVFTLYVGGSVAGSNISINYSSSVRCIKYVSSELRIPILYTNEVTNKTSSSAFSGGQIFSDGGANVVERGIVWSTYENPTITDNEGITIDGEGMGSFVSNITGLQPQTIYYARAYATNSLGTAYGNDIRFRTTSDVIENCGIIFDSRDGQEYNTVIIGTQCWMAENLNVGTRIESADNQTNNAIIEKYCYNNNEENCSVYGGLYQFNEIFQYSTQSGVQGICPSGWHVPVLSEWDLLTSFLGGENMAGGELKSTGTFESGSGLWLEPNQGATNSSGFNALPGGFLDNYYNYGFVGLHNTAIFCSSDFPQLSTWSHSISSGNIELHTTTSISSIGYSVRCVKD